MMILGLGLGMALLYALWVVWVPLLPTNLYVPLLDLGKITGYTWPSTIYFLAIVLSLYLLYAGGYWLVSRDRARLPLIFGCAALFCLELILAYPATAADVFGYIAHGRLFALHQANPFVLAPRAFTGEPILPYLAFPDEPSQYGPVWVLLGGLLARLAGGNLLSEILLYKAVGALAHLAGGWLIYRIARALTADRARARACAYLYLWNPLLLWEMVGNAHNDGAMMLAGLSAARLFVIRRPLLVLPALALGALAKIPVLLTAPVFFLGGWRIQRARVMEGVLLGVGLALAVYHPFWEGFNTLAVLRRTDLFTASLGSVLRLGLEPSLGQLTATAVARWVSLGGFAGVALAAVFLAARTDEPQDILRLAYFTMLAALLLATTWFQAWYVAWPFAFGAALPEPRRHLEVGLLSLGGLLQYVVFIYLWVMGVLPPAENVVVQSAAYLCIVGPLLLGVVIRSSTPQRARVYRRA